MRVTIAECARRGKQASHACNLLGSVLWLASLYVGIVDLEAVGAALFGAGALLGLAVAALFP